MFSLLLFFLMADNVTSKCNSDVKSDSNSSSSYTFSTVDVAWRYTFDEPRTGYEADNEVIEEKLMEDPERVGGKVLFCENNCLPRFEHHPGFYDSVVSRCEKDCDGFAFSVWLKVDKRHKENNFILFELLEGVKPYWGMDAQFRIDKGWYFKIFYATEEIDKKATTFEAYRLLPENPYRWHHVAIRRDEDNALHGYLNGKLYDMIKSTAYSAYRRTSMLYLPTSSAEMFVYLDEYVAWEKDVGEEKVLEHYFNDATVIEEEREYEEMRLISRYNNL